MRSLKPTSGTVILLALQHKVEREMLKGQIQPVAVEQYLIMFLKIGTKKSFTTLEQKVKIPY